MGGDFMVLGSVAKIGKTVTTGTKLRTAVSGVTAGSLLGETGFVEPIEGITDGPDYGGGGSSGGSGGFPTKVVGLFVGGIALLFALGSILEVNV